MPRAIIHLTFGSEIPSGTGVRPFPVSGAHRNSSKRADYFGIVFSDTVLGRTKIIRRRGFALEAIDENCVK